MTANRVRGVLVFASMLTTGVERGGEGKRGRWVEDGWKMGVTDPHFNFYHI